MRRQPLSSEMHPSVPLPLSNNRRKHAVLTYVSCISRATHVGRAGIACGRRGAWLRRQTYFSRHAHLRRPVHDGRVCFSVCLFVCCCVCCWCLVCLFLSVVRF